MLRRTFPVLAATVLVACGGGDDDATPATQPPATAAPADTAPADTAPAADTGNGAAAVPAALDFTAPLVGGGEIEMGSLAGRPVLLWFWAPW